MEGKVRRCVADAHSARRRVQPYMLTHIYTNLYTLSLRRLTFAPLPTMIP